jgi:hypothetical protein
MTSTTDVTLIEQRQTLRRQLVMQRQVIEHQLEPSALTTSGYPRSMTMRFLIRRPDLVVRLLTRLTKVLRSK